MVACRAGRVPRHFVNCPLSSKVSLDRAALSSPLRLQIPSSIG